MFSGAALSGEVETLLLGLFTALSSLDCRERADRGGAWAGNDETPVSLVFAVFGVMLGIATITVILAHPA
jgi:hypothetical protein